MDKETTVSATQILIADSSNAVRWTARKILEKDHIVHEAEDGQTAWDLLQQNEDIAVVFIASQLPVIDGCRLLKKIRSSDNTQLANIAVIVISNHDDDDEGREHILNIGATDFITKPFDSITLKTRTAAYAGYGYKLTELEGKTEEDPLTGLLNKSSFFAQGEKVLALATRHKMDLTIALLEPAKPELFSDKAYQQAINRLWAMVGEKIQAGLRAEDLAARIGPTRFALILPLTNRFGAQQAVERICRDINTSPIKLEGLPTEAGFCAGLTSLNRQQGLVFHQLIEQADSTLRMARSQDNRSAVNGLSAAPHHSVTKNGADGRYATMPASGYKLEQPHQDMHAIRAIKEIEKGLGGYLGDSLLIGLLKTIWPLLDYANTRLGLGMESALNNAENRMGKLAHYEEPASSPLAQDKANP